MRTASVPSYITKTVELVCDLRYGSGDDTVVQRHEKDGETERENDKAQADATGILRLVLLLFFRSGYILVARVGFWLRLAFGAQLDIVLVARSIQLAGLFLAHGLVHVVRLEAKAGDGDDSLRGNKMGEQESK